MVQYEKRTDGLVVKNIDGEELNCIAYVMNDGKFVQAFGVTYPEALLKLSSNISYQLRELAEFSEEVNRDITALFKEKGIV